MRPNNRVIYGTLIKSFTHLRFINCNKVNRVGSFINQIKNIINKLIYSLTIMPLKGAFNIQQLMRVQFKSWRQFSPKITHQD